MMADEGAKQAIDILIRLAYGAVSVSGSVARLSSGGLAQMMRLTSTGMSQARTRLLETGQVSVKQLQRTSGGGLRVQEVSPALLRSVRADLRRRGVSFAVEKGADGRSYVHFSGRDTETVQHALSQVSARLESPAVRRARSRTAQGQDRTVGVGQPTQPRTKQQVLDEIRNRQRAIDSVPRHTQVPRHTHTRGAQVPRHTHTRGAR